jgi:hypothetical protein
MAIRRLIPEYVTGDGWQPLKKAFRGRHRGVFKEKKLFKQKLGESGSTPSEEIKGGSLTK